MSDDFFDGDMAEVVELRPLPEIPEAIAAMNLPVAQQIGTLDFDARCIVATSATGSGKSILIAPWECLLNKSQGRPHRIWMRQPTRVSCFSILRALRKFWAGSGLTFGICTAENKEDLDADIVLYSDGSLHQGLGDSTPLTVYFDEIHALGVPQCEIELAICKMRPNVKIRCLSATIDPKTLIEYLGPGTKSYELSGRTFPIEKDVLCIVEEGFDRNKSMAAIDEAVSQIAMEALMDGQRVLVFMPTKPLCEQAAAQCESLLPCTFAHGEVYPQDILDWVEAHVEGPFLIFATIALATGVTLPLDRVCILDDRMQSDMRSGVVRSFPTKMDANTAVQMCGRVGRTHPGRATLITSPTRRPLGWGGIVPGPIDTPCARTTPYGVVMAMADEGVTDISKLDLLSKIKPWELSHARDWLLRHGCIDQSGMPTALGRRVHNLPLEVPFAHLVATAPTAASKLVALAAVCLGSEGLFSTLGVKAGKEYAAARERNPDFQLLPRECVVVDSMPTTLACILQRAYRARDRSNQTETLRGWCQANNLKPKALEFAMRDFDEASKHFTKTGRDDLLAIDIPALRRTIHRHFGSHELFVDCRFDSEWSRLDGKSAVVESEARDAFHLEGGFTAWGIRKEIQYRNGTGSFLSLGMAMVERDQPNVL